jgi:hypothetical protein
MKRHARVDRSTITELANAMIECKKCPIIPPCFQKLGEFSSPVGDLKGYVRSIKDDLPLLLLQSSGAEIAELSTRLRTCVELARKIVQFEPQIEEAVRLMSKFEKEVDDLWLYADNMTCEANFSYGAPW